MTQGKGSRPRPVAVDAATYAARWAATFGGGRSEDRPDGVRAAGAPSEATAGVVAVLVRDQHGREWMAAVVPDLLRRRAEDGF